MAWLTRVVVPEVPHHVTQRGHGRLTTFYGVDDWRGYVAAGLGQEQAALSRRHERTGRPLGNATFLKRLESTLGRVLRRKPPGRKPGNKRK